MINEAVKDVRETPPDKETLEGKRILIVDDEEPIRVFFSRVFERAGAKVEVCSNGREAWEKIQKGSQGGSYDLLITDNHMPQMTGPALIKAVREHSTEEISNLPTILMSGDLYIGTKGDLDKIQKKARSHGANTGMSKPVQLASLIKTAENVLFQLPPPPSTSGE